MTSRSRGPMSLPTSQLDPEASASKERDIISSHRLKLAEYIHDVTLLFPHMKQRSVFTKDDCDIIANEVPTTLKVDKFVDVLLTKGPRAIGVFHESLDAQYPAMFDYLSRLLTNAGVQLPGSRQLKDREEESGPVSPPIGGPSRPGSFRRHGSKTVRKSLEVLSRQFEVMQKERGELHEQLIKREQEIGSLLGSHKTYQDDLLQVTQKYQQMLSELVDWRRIISNQSEGGNQKFQELLAEREQVQQEYDDLEGEVMLVSSELSAARDRISRLRAHLERSEKVHSLEKEKLKDSLERQISQKQRQIQRLTRKLERESNMGRVAASNGEEEGPVEDRCNKLQIELEQSKDECCDLMDRLEVAHIERTEAIVEKDDIVLKYHTEKERRRRAERELRDVHRYLDSQGLLNTSSPTTPPYSGPSSGLNARSRVEELTVNIPVNSAEGHGMVLDCGVIVTDLVENGLSVAHGVRQGDEIRQVNSINLCSDKDPLEFASRLLDSAAQNISLTIRRQVPASYHRSRVATPTSSLATPTSSGLFNPLDPQAPARRTSAEHPNFLPVRLLRPFSVPAPIPHKMNRFSSVPYEKSHDDQTTSSEGRAPSVSEESGVDSLEPGSISDSDRPAGLLIARGSPHRISQMSQDSEGSGLYCTSPPPCACARDSMELPDNITLRPTLDSRHTFPEPDPCILQEGEEEGEEGEREGSDNDVCLLQSSLDSAHRRPHTDSVTTNSGTDESVKSYPGHRSRTPWQSQSVENNLALASEPDQRRNARVGDQPGELESEDETHPLHRTPVIRRPIRRHRVSREERLKRVSRSLDDLTQFVKGHEAVILTPVLPNQSGNGNWRQVRRVLLPQGQLGASLHLIGGRGIGIFIYSEKQNTEDGLHSGDQLTKVDSKSVENMTYAEVQELLESYSLKRRQCIITVQQNLEGYAKVPKHVRDNFYVRAKYAHTKRSGIPNELLFEKGTIFNVVDTLPDQQKEKGMWRVNKINCLGEVVEAGFVPTRLSITEMMPEANSLPRFLHNFSPKLIRRNGAVTLDYHTERTSASSGFLLFEPIRKVKVTDPRPVVLLGALEVDVRRYLVEHGSTTDIKFSYCKREPLCELEHVPEKEFVEMTTLDGQEMRSTASHVQELAGQGYHCVLCFKRPEELHRPIMAVFCPIVVLLDTTSTRTVNRIRTSVNIPADRIDNPQLHLERIKEVKKYMHIITGRVELSASMTMWDVVTTVRSLIQRQQESIVWEVEDS